MKKKFIVRTPQRYYHSCRYLERLKMGPSLIFWDCSSEATIPGSINKILDINKNSPKIN
jgi:hypothetical protein